MREGEDYTMLGQNDLIHKIWTVIFYGCVLFLLIGCTHYRSWRSLPDRSLPYDLAWRTLQDTASMRYSHFVVDDQARGYIQTDWREERDGSNIGIPVNRTRLFLWIVKREPVRIYLKVERQTYSLPLGRWLNVPSEADPLLQEVADAINSKLQRF